MLLLFFFYPSSLSRLLFFQGANNRIALRRARTNREIIIWNTHFLMSIFNAKERKKKIVAVCVHVAGWHWTGTVRSLNFPPFILSSLPTCVPALLYHAFIINKRIAPGGGLRPWRDSHVTSRPLNDHHPPTTSLSSLFLALSLSRLPAIFKLGSRSDSTRSSSWAGDWWPRRITMTTFASSSTIKTSPPSLFTVSCFYVIR